MGRVLARATFFLAVAIILGGGAAPASATTLSFEGLACNTAPGAFGGFTFSSAWTTTCNVDGSGSGYTEAGGMANSSGAFGNVAVGNWLPEYPDTSFTTLSRPGNPFNFLGGYASSFIANNDYVPGVSSLVLQVEGFLGGVSVGSPLIIDLAATPGFSAFSASLLGIDELRFFSSGDLGITNTFDQWLIDDLQYEDTTVAPVPEPGQLVLFGSGLSLLAVVLRSQRRNRERADAGSR